MNTCGKHKHILSHSLPVIASVAVVAMLAGCSLTGSGSASTAAATVPAAATVAAAENTAQPALSTSVNSSDTAAGTQATALLATPDTTSAASGTSVATDASAGSTAAATVAATDGSSASASGTPATTGTSQPSVNVNTVDLTTGIRAVAQMDKPAVVQITNEQVQMDQFNQAFTVPAGVGSGVIYDQQGHILTNNHVIADASQLEVSLTDGRSFSATLVGTDPQTDLAVIQIQGANLPMAQLGDSSQVQVGDWVVAIGNALALPGGPTVTAGVASALGRTVQEPGDSTDPNSSSTGPFLFDVIQTSAPINPGNSGGPLVDLNGRVIGIDTLVAGQAEPGVPAQGIGFAIAINTAKPIADELVANGHVAHPFIGISYVPLTPSIASQIGTSAKTGIVVAQVVAGSPAEKAGLQERDVITAVDGNDLKDESDLARAMGKHKPGDTVSLTVVRGSSQMKVSITLAEMPAQ
jgi:serine protease Do